MTIAEITHIDDLAARAARELAVFGLYPAADHEDAAGRALAAELIGGTIVPAAEFRRVHRRCGMALFLAREEGRLTGMLAFVPLTSAGMHAVWTDEFDAQAPADAHVARRGEVVCALYGWGVAAATRESAVRLVEGARAFGRGAAAHLANYARPATPRGERLMREKLGFEDLPGSKTGLVWSPSFLSKAAAAA
jgi:hypothetical protein